LTDESKLDAFTALQDIIARLRGPEGCPWDKLQTHASLKPYLIEECYEVIQALEGAAPGMVCEELGDLLLQIMLHAQIAAEAGEFTITDVIRCLSDKLVTRHPHVFGGRKIRDIKELEYNWETLKEKDREEGESLLSGVPEQMPALTYSQSIQRRVASVGFDWDKTDDIIDKLAEEIDEFKNTANDEEKSREFGDLVFTLVNIARRMGIDSETALRAANKRFYERFSHMESLCRQRGLKLDSLSLDDQNSLWEEAKSYLE